MEKSDALLKDIIELLRLFEDTEKKDDLRGRVKALIPVFDSLRELGKNLVPDGLSMSARDRLLKYFLSYPGTILHERELAVIAGISEWARRVRELRIEHGWKIASGMTIGEMQVEGDVSIDDVDVSMMHPNDYILLTPVQDVEARERWHLANQIRKLPGGSKEKILKYLRANVGKPVTGEELSYVAQSSEWARRTRELRTEEGWPISTKMSGNPDLVMGEYMLETDRQAPSHDRRISEDVRRQVLRRDGYSCQKCGWSHVLWNTSDPRFLEIHHILQHAKGGSNTLDNLITLCNICHDVLHKLDKNT